MGQSSILPIHIMVLVWPAASSTPSVNRIRRVGKEGFRWRRFLIAKHSWFLGLYETGFSQKTRKNSHGKYPPPHTVKMGFDFPVSSGIRESLVSDIPARGVWLLTSRLGTGESLTFFTVYMRTLLKRFTALDLGITILYVGRAVSEQSTRELFTYGELYVYPSLSPMPSVFVPKTITLDQHWLRYWKPMTQLDMKIILATVYCTQVHENVVGRRN